MRIRNKILASILTASMVSSMLSGCAGVADVAAVGQAPAEPSVEESAPSEEEIAAEEEAEAAAQNMLAIKAAGYTGLTNLTNENYEDGSYFYEDMTEDGITVITNMCAQAESTADGSVED